jgi:small subunit ribosomal protein S2
MQQEMNQSSRMPVSMRSLFEAGVHFGHQTRSWNPKMAPFIYGTRNRVHIINLEKTLPLFTDALNFVGRIAARGGKILFVGTKEAASETIKAQAERCGMPYVDYRWLGGELTNFKTIRQSVNKLNALEAMQAEVGKFFKKEALLRARQLNKLSRSLSGIREMNSLPDAIFVLDVGYEDICVKEANKLGIPVIGVVDTNNSPEGIDYVIPGNDDALRAIQLYASSVADAILDAKNSQHTQPPAGESEFVEIKD